MKFNITLLVQFANKKMILLIAFVSGSNQFFTDQPVALQSVFPLKFPGANLASKFPFLAAIEPRVPHQVLFPFVTFAANFTTMNVH